MNDDAISRRLIGLSGDAGPASAGSAPHDPDPAETAEWRDALRSLLEVSGPERVRQVMDMLAADARQPHVGWLPTHGTPYVNTIPVEQQPRFPGDLAIEERLASLMRWNALAMVVRANSAHGELGGHIASYASAADLFEVGFNHFFRARNTDADPPQGGDLVFFQPHSAPGVYARAFLEGRLTENDLAHYRQELTAKQRGARGLSSYPHPWLMPDFWQFPTGSMGIGPISSIYHARFMRYLTHRKLLDCSERKVWGVFGDGEMDEPESMSALTLASRERLDNLVWVVNCNLQRLDGPVRGNGRIVDELETLFGGAGWRVIKLLWGSDWDGLFARDATGALVRAFAHTVDGQMQTFAAKDGRYNRDHFFGQNEELARLAQGMTDEQIDRLKRGGHDLVKIHAAYHAAVTGNRGNRGNHGNYGDNENHEYRGQPVVILAHTKKGYGMGAAGQGRMTTHSQKKLDEAALLEFRNRFNLPLSDEQAKNLDFYKPADDSAEMRYLHERRRALGGYLPQRPAGPRAVPAPAGTQEPAAVDPRLRGDDTIPVPPLDAYAAFALRPGGHEMSTTMAFVRLLANLLKDRALGPRIVPIVADEARTFGMANLFKQVGIYSNFGQQYEPEDIGSVLAYREAVDGQILEEGISEAGALASWTAAATSYSVHGFPMLPFYIYYSMFGFQRVGDAIWAAADQRARGFLLGATAGRTTLAGEGLQHQDGSSHLVASTIPNCRAYDPAFAGEMATIVAHGMHEMLVEQRDVFYYVTLMNENYAQPDVPPEAQPGIVRGGYRFAAYGSGAPQVTLLGSGAILTEVIKAAQMLAADRIASEVFSITSWSEIARDGLLHQQRTLRGEAAPPPYLHELLAGGAAGDALHRAPIVAATDYVRAVPESVRAFLPEGRRYLTLGTDGFGRSDTRAALRAFFGVDAASIEAAARRLIRG